MYGANVSFHCQDPTADDSRRRYLSATFVQRNMNCDEKDERRRLLFETRYEYGQRTGNIVHKRTTMQEKQLYDNKKEC